MPKQQITIPIFIPHLGCPHRCIFCNQWETSSVKSLPDDNYIEKKVKEYTSNIGETVNRIEIAFFGGSFTGIDFDRQVKLLSAAQKHLKNREIHGIRLSTRPDYIDHQRLDILKKYGVSTIELGAQSFSDKVLEASNRGHTTKDIFKAINLIKEYRFDFVIQLMPGLPYDTKDISVMSAEISSKLMPSAVRIYPAIVLKNTGLEKLYLNNQFHPLSMDKAVDICKEMYLVFNRNKIPVIRMGLHPFSPEEAENIIAGPYHPSFGFLVKSRVRRDEMIKGIRKLIDDNKGSEHKVLELAITEKCKEEYIGNKKENILFIKQIFGFKQVKYTVESIYDLRIEIKE